MAVLFAMDGLPTECEPQEIAPIADLAAAGFAATPSVRTFVIGVFGPQDTDAPELEFDCASWRNRERVHRPRFAELD